jgi:hypothetical protein
MTHLPVSSNSDQHSAWEEILRFVEERRKLGITGHAYRWNREEIYQERENRWLNNQFPKNDNHNPQQNGNIDPTQDEE